MDPWIIGAHTKRESALSLKTERLRLVPLTEDHEFELRCLDSDPLVAQLMTKGRVPSPDATRRRLQRYASLWTTHEFGFWLAYELPHLVLRGRCGLCNPVGENHEVQLAYCFTELASGRGLALEASQAVLTYAFNNLRVPSVTADVRPTNLRSARVLQKLGFRFVQDVTKPDGIFNRYELESLTFRGVSANSL